MRSFCSSGDEDDDSRGWRLNCTHDGGQMNQHSTSAPGTRRHALQWSKEMTGMRSLTSLIGTRRRCSVAGVCGRGLRSESSGTEMV
jgi:hypothetical protein